MQRSTSDSTCSLWNRLLDVTLGVLVGILAATLLSQKRGSTREPALATNATLKEQLLAAELREARKHNPNYARTYPSVTKN